MKEATLVYPNQLFDKTPALKKGRKVFLIDEPLILTHNPIHIQKLIFHKLSMDSYHVELEKNGYTVSRLSIKDYPKTKDIFEKLRNDNVEKIHVVDTVDYYLEKAITDSGIERVWYDSPMFILPKNEAMERYTSSKRFMANFYKKIRKDKNILIDKNGEPEGGKWSFDEENRKKLPKKIELPEDIILYENTDIDSATEWVQNVKAEKYGDVGCWLPYTQKTAKKFLSRFCENNFEQFGKYEDAISTKGSRLFHSALSPLINAGLLTPQEVLETVIEYAKNNNTPINSLEGFVRQIIGWREFIRASYEVDGVKMRTTNFWKHTRSLHKSFWTGETNIYPIDISINKTIAYGYNHHIERLMVLGNFMLLSKTNPDDVYKWFMGMYVDAYDWVMVPNVYGMSQFADGGLFATKPYISGSNYLKKMSDYSKGEWEDIWTSLYWNFIDTNAEFFKSNYRLSMMPRLLDKMDKEKKENHLEVAKKYLK